MPGRHSLTSEATLNALNSPMGRSTAAALVAGTILGVVLPSANATQDSAANALAPVTEVAHQGAGTGTTAVTAAADAAWQLEQVSDASGIQVDASTQAQLVKEAAAGQSKDAETQTTVRTTAASETAATAGATAKVSTVQAVEEAAPAASSSATGSEIVATAMSYIGSPYAWGGTTPAGWDCIGFVRYVYAKYGVHMGGYTSSVLNVGHRVSYSEAQPGDILYWPGHVAIYIGNGKNVGAWNESMGTRVGPNSWVGNNPIVIRVFN